VCRPQSGRATLRCLADHVVEVKVPVLSGQRLAAEFTVMYSARDPGFGMNRVGRFDRSSPRPFRSLPVFAFTPIASNSRAGAAGSSA
jgi:hypothetical protein